MTLYASLKDRFGDNGVVSLFIGEIVADTLLVRLWLMSCRVLKRDLEKAAQVSHYTMNKLTHGDNVTTDVLARICFALDVDVGDIMEIIPDDKGETTHGA